MDPVEGLSLLVTNASGTTKIIVAQDAMAYLTMEREQRSIPGNVTTPLGYVDGIETYHPGV